jgi:hypothetical protein
VLGTRPTFVEGVIPIISTLFMRPVSPAKLLRLLTFSVLGLGLLLGTSCSKTAADEQDSLMSNDFDHLTGWIEDVSSLTRDEAHSGTYSVVVKPGIERSLVYNITLGQLSRTRPHKVSVSAWVMRTGDQNAAQLIVKIKDPITGAQVFGDSINLGRKVHKTNNWQRIEHIIEVPPMVSATSHIMVYMSGVGGSQPTYLDDLALNLVAK